MRQFYLFAVILLITSCTSLKIKDIKDKETYGHVLFKSLKKKSENLDRVYIEGMIKISGIEDIPSAYIKCQILSLYKKNKVNFKMLSFNKPVIDIIIDNNVVKVINHTNKEYIELNVEKIDMSKVTGINFNPIDMSYLFLGCIPYSESMELLDFDISKNGYIMNISDNVSKYTINLNSKEQITSVKVYNQYFENINLKSIRYKDEKKEIPYMFTFVNEDSSVSISFVINRIDFKTKKTDLVNNKIIQNYKKVNSIDKIKLNFKDK